MGTPRTLFQAPLALEAWTLHKTADGAHPDGNEQQFVWFMNRARANPPQEGAWLSATGDPDVEGAIAYFGVDLMVLQDEFNLIDAKPPAAFDVRLYDAARAHSENLIDKDGQDHDGQFGRIDSAGFDYTQAAGIVFSYMRSALQGYAAFNIDWGNDGGDGTGMQPGRGHRRAIMSVGGDYTNMGLAAVAVDDVGKAVGPLVATGNFCRADPSSIDHYNRFLVGTVWQDADGDDQYDPGEGMGGITVMPDDGTYYAITADGGGYALPILTAGTYTVTFSGGSLAAAVDRTAVVGDQSVLLDLLYEPAVGGDLQVITLPATAISTSAASLNGTVIPGGESVDCFFQYGTTTAYGAATPTESMMVESDVTAVVNGLTPDTTYHFRFVAVSGETLHYGDDQEFQTPASAAAPNDDDVSRDAVAGDAGGGGGGCFITLLGR